MKFYAGLPVHEFQGFTIWISQKIFVDSTKLDVSIILLYHAYKYIS